MAHKPSTRMDTRDIGLRIASIFGKHFLHTEHLHYGYWPEGMKVELGNLAEAQRLYAELLLKHIPKGVKSILDVGCGTGHNAEFLGAHGFELDGVSPSVTFAELARPKMSDEAEIFECKFEAVETDKRYDLILFSESFQYIDLASAFEKCREFLNPGGYILISDFFRIPADGSSPMGGGHRLPRFYATLEALPFKIITDLDITANTAPNLQLVDAALQEVAVPVRDLVIETLDRNYHGLYRIMRIFAKLFYRRKLVKLEDKYFSGRRNAENFAKFKSYRLLVLKMDDAS